MKNRKRDFGARFWSGTRRHSTIGLLETFFQFNDLAIVKEAITAMVQYSVQKNTRITGHPEEIFHLHQSLRSLVRAGSLIAGKAGKRRFRTSEENRTSVPPGSLSAEEYQHPVKVFRKAFKTCSLEEYDNFLSAAVYFSLGDLRCEEERRIIIPYIQLMKMLDAAWLIVERASSGK